jgi:kinetochore protein NNF1
MLLSIFKAFAKIDHGRPHTLPPSDLLTAHLSPFLLEQQALLTTSLTAVEKETVQLGGVIQEQRAEIEKLVAGLEAMMRDVEKAAGMVQDGAVMDGLGGEVREMEAQLRVG